MKCLVTIVLCTFLCLSGSHAAFAQDLGATESDIITEYRWVGLTTTTTDGSIQAEFGALQGHSAMHQMCVNEVALNARACFTSEIVRSVVQGSRIRTGWVIPTGHLLHYDPNAASGQGWFGQDTATGMTGASFANASDASGSLDCGGFLDNTSGETGGIVASPVGLLQTSCAARHAIACCAPVTIPVIPYP